MARGKRRTAAEYDARRAAQRAQFGAPRIVQAGDKWHVEAGGLIVATAETLQGATAAMARWVKGERFNA